jgi:uncharacterized protein (UPF0179 family)
MSSTAEDQKICLTFVGKSFARKGFRFYYQGVHPTCNVKCNLYNTCQNNLVPDTIYEIIELIKSNPITIKSMPCPLDLHEEEMILVKVKIPDLVVGMRNKEIFEGSITSFVPMDCNFKDCPNHEFCAPELMIQRGDKLRIKDRLEKIDKCKKGEGLSKVRVEKK